MAVDFKSEQEVKEYLENLLIEYKFGCYKEKDPRECQFLGDYMEGITQNWEEAAKIFKTNCDEYNYSQSCKKYGIYRLIGRGCQKDTSDGIDYLKKSCELENDKGCLLAGVSQTMPEYYRDKTSEAEKAAQITTGISMLEKACNTHELEQACFVLSNHYRHGISNFLEKDMQKMHKFSSKACELGNPYACANLSHMYAKGDGVEKDEVLAESFKRRSLKLYNEMTQAPSVEFQQGVKL